MADSIGDMIAQALADVLIEYGGWSKITIQSGQVHAEKS